jgi:hypothetical protein
VQVCLRGFESNLGEQLGSPDRNQQQMPSRLLQGAHKSWLYEHAISALQQFRQQQHSQSSSARTTLLSTQSAAGTPSLECLSDLSCLL